MNMLRDLRTQHGQQTTEAVVTGDDFGVEMGEAAIDEVVAQLAFQIAEAPAFQVLEHTAAQEAIGSQARAPGAGRLGPGSLPGQGGVEEPGLVMRGGGHSVLEYIE